MPGSILRIVSIDPKTREIGTRRNTEPDGSGWEYTMLKVFLVEDEAIVRESLRDNIPWTECGFEFAEALHIIKYPTNNNEFLLYKTLKNVFSWCGHGMYLNQSELFL